MNDLQIGFAVGAFCGAFGMVAVLLFINEREKRR